MFGVHPWQVAGGSAASRALFPTPSRSLQFRVLRSPLRQQRPPVGLQSFLGTQPTGNDGSPCSFTPLRLGK